MNNLVSPRLGLPKVTKRHNLLIKRLKMRLNIEKLRNPTPD